MSDETRTDGPFTARWRIISVLTLVLVVVLGAKVTRHDSRNMRNMQKDLDRLKQRIERLEKHHPVKQIKKAKSEKK